MYQEKIQRHKASQKFNRYRVIDRPPPKETIPPSKDVGTEATGRRTKIPQPRPRYSFKKRSRRKQHEPPEAMKQYKWKPWKTRPEDPADEDPDIAIENQDKDPGSNLIKDPLETAYKVDVARAMNWEHPTVTLDIGTVAANVKEALKDESDLVAPVLECLQEVVRLATTAKRSCQQLIGCFVESIAMLGVFQESDRVALDYICERIKPKGKGRAAGNTDNNKQEQDDNDSGEKNDKQLNFLMSLVRYLYSGNYPKNQGTGVAVNKFIARLEEMGLLAKGDRYALNTETAYTPTDLTRSVACQLYVELKRTYRNGSFELQKKVRLHSIAIYQPMRQNRHRGITYTYIRNPPVTARTSERERALTQGVQHRHPQRSFHYRELHSPEQDQ